MLDINLLLEERGGNPEMVKESQKRRGGSVEIIDEIIAEYKEWTACMYNFMFQISQLKRLLNNVFISPIHQ
jgi:seryl-tRNA synthetase